MVIRWRTERTRPPTRRTQTPTGRRTTNNSLSGTKAPSPRAKVLFLLLRQNLFKIYSDLYFLELTIIHLVTILSTVPKNFGISGRGCVKTAGSKNK
jgi:hypothetical protein